MKELAIAVIVLYIVYKGARRLGFFKKSGSKKSQGGSWMDKEDKLNDNVKPE